MARKKTTPEEEVNVTTAAEEPAAQDVPLTEDGMPPGNMLKEEPTADAVQPALYPNIIENRYYKILSNCCKNFV